jgi:hypothetical protein
LHFGAAASHKDKCTSVKHFGCKKTHKRTVPTTKCTTDTPA